jgi:tetratricopeptide (TPR) repeat protein
MIFDRMIKFRSIFFLIISITVFSCSSEKKQEDKEEMKSVKTDSLLEKINSPELKAVNEALKKDPENDSLYRERAMLYVRFQIFEEAVGDALRAVNIDSANAKNYVTLADVYFANNKTRYAKETLESTVKKFPKSTEALLKLGELFFLVRQYENAITQINSALKIDENLAHAYYLKGSVFKEMGDTTKAISSMQTAIEQDNKYYDAFVSVGVLYASRRNPLAFEYYDNALRIRPNDETVLYNKAKLYQDMNKIAESEAIYDKLLATNKNNSKVLYNLGAISLDKKKDANKAVDYFSKAIASDPKYTEAYFARGLSFEMLKDISNAKADYNMCLQITPNYEPAIDALNALQK